jgi:outer membrane biosynthesis protein TonB
MVEYRRQAARRIVAANPATAGSGALQDPLLGIVVLKVKLNGDGSIRTVDVDRASKVAPSVNQLAVEAVRRTTNFGAISHLPQPWEFNETFLYDDAKKFQLVTIVENR